MHDRFHHHHHNGFFDNAMTGTSDGHRYENKNPNHFRGENNFHASKSGLLDSRKRMRGYNGSNFTEGYLNKRSVGSKPNLDHKGSNVGQAKP
jgi:hypothetical protein